jgi:hypothetical protein
MSAIEADPPCWHSATILWRARPLIILLQRLASVLPSVIPSQWALLRKGECGSDNVLVDDALNAVTAHLQSLHPGTVGETDDCAHGQQTAPL